MQLHYYKLHAASVVTRITNGTHAIVVNKILYALSVYFGYLTQDQKLMLQHVFKRAYRSGLVLYECDLETLAEEAQCNLFRNSLSDNHCSNHLYSA